ncbi:MAG: GAF domain-containing protein [Polyangiales bacterium]
MGGLSSRLQGDAPLRERVLLRAPGAPASRWVEVFSAPSVARGAPARIVALRDVDPAARRELEQRFVLEASKILGASLDLDRTLADVGRLVVPHLADWFAIDLVDDDGGLRRVAVAHVDPAKVEYAWELWRRYPPKREDPGGPYAVIAERRTARFEEIPDALIEQSVPDAELKAIVRALGLASSMCVPLVARGRALGALSLVSAESGRRYSARDQEFAEDFALRIATAVDNASLYDEAVRARQAAEAMAAELTAQSRAVESALRAMRDERDDAIARLGEAGGAVR